MAISVVSFSFSWCSTRGLGTQPLWDMFTFQHLLTNWSGLQTPSGVLRAPSAGWWLSLPPLVSNSSDLQQLTSCFTKLYNSSVTPLSLWNGMFDRHQVEITVMQFTGHSFPVHQSMSVPWDFLPCPIFSAKSAYVISPHNCHRNVSLPSGASLWNGTFGQVKGQYTTIRLLMMILKEDFADCFEK